MSVRVVDLNNEAVEEERPVVEASEEVPQEEAKEIVNEVVETTNEQPKEEKPKEEAPKPKRQTQKDRIQCPKCLKEVSLKTYRYSHEKNCGGQLSEKPVKPHTNPRPKQQSKSKPKVVPKKAPELYYSESDDTDEETPQQLSIKKKKPIQQTFNPTATLAQHYQILQNQMIQQKQERYNNLCKNMFSSKSKKR